MYAQQIPDGMTGTPVKYFRADHIEELEAKLANKCVRADRIEELEANLAEAVDALGGMVSLFSVDNALRKGSHLNMELDHARTTLGELRKIMKEMKDD